MSTLKTNNIQHVDLADPSILLNSDGSVSIAGTVSYEDVTSVDAVGIITGRLLVNAQKQVHVGTGVSVKAGGLNVTAGITTVQALQATTGNFSSNLDVAGELTVAETIAHTGDTNNKISFPSADTITLTTAGSERLRIMSSGAIGIRTTTGSNTVNIGGAAGLGVKFHNFTTGNSSFITLESGDKLQSNVGGSGYYTWVTGGTEKLRITSAGRVGINETSPDNMLHVRNDNSAAAKIGGEGGAAYYMEIGQLASSSSPGFNATGSSTSMLFQLNGSEKMRINSSGLVGIGTAPETNANLHIMGASRGRVIVHAGGSESAQLWLRNPKRTWKIHNYYDQDSLIFTDDSDTRLTINAQGDATFSGIVTATTFVPTVGQLANRNLVINGAMRVAQRATSYTGGYGVGGGSDAYYKTVDRILVSASNLPNTDVTSSQVALTSGAPYDAGFRYAFQLQMGYQASVPTNVGVNLVYRMEAQDIACSGWDHKSSSSYITLSFWAKSTVSRTFYGLLRTIDGTNYKYPFSYALTANTWKKVEVTAPGNSNLTLNNDTGEGLRINLAPYLGTDNTASGVTLNTWSTHSNSAKTPDQTSTWYSTNGATFQVTGLQLEVGQTATPFEHKSYQEDFLCCQRYCQKYTCTAQEWIYVEANGAEYKWWQTYFNPMRATPTVDITDLSTGSGTSFAGGSGQISSIAVTSTSGNATNGRVSYRITGSAAWGTAKNVHHTDSWSGDSVLYSSEL